MHSNAERVSVYDKMSYDINLSPLFQNGTVSKSNQINKKEQNVVIVIPGTVHGLFQEILFHQHDMIETALLD